MSLVALGMRGMYRPSGHPLQRPVTFEIVRVAQALMTAVLLILAIDAVRDGLRQSDSLPITAFVLVLGGLVTIPLLRRLVGWRSAFFRHPSSRMTRVLVVGSGTVADRLVTRLQRSGRIDVVGMVDDDPLPGYKSLGSLADIPNLCRNLHIDRILVAFSATPSHDVIESLYNLTDVNISIVPRLYEMLNWRCVIEEIDGLALVNVATPQLWPAAKAAKRSLDIAVSLVVGLLLLPLGVICAIAIKLGSPGTVFFRQDQGRDTWRTIPDFQVPHHDRHGRI